MNFQKVKMNHTDDSLLTDDASLEYTMKQPSHENNASDISKKEERKLRFIQEKLSHFAERLCLRQRLADILLSLEHSDFYASQVYNMNHKTHQRNFSSDA